jgi:gliding motility-associated-like protein
MNKVFTLLLIILIFSFVPLYATHNRAGEITFRLVSGYTYEVTVTTYTYTESAANRSELTVDWGDNSTSIVPLKNRVTLPDDIYHNTYVAKHTFPGPGIYKIYMEDPNRNYGVVNIPNSVNVVFSISTMLIINPQIGDNNTSELLTEPVDKAALYHTFIHNPSAYDIDGDSLSYALSVCTEQDGKAISDYELPASNDTLYVNPVTGDLVWDAPTAIGEYNIAMKIYEWRKGVKISSITRDMQIEVFKTDNNPPVNPNMTNLCVEAGTLIELQFTSTDIDKDSIIQTMTGGPFEMETEPATLTGIADGKGYSISTFKWQTTCDHVRKQPYQLTLKSKDDNNDVNLVDIDNFTIRVLANAPENLQTTANTAEINLSWDQGSCGNIAGYKIYRREGAYGFIPDSCENGVPSYTGYSLIATVKGASDTTYTDNNAGAGLIQGTEYCYMVTSYYDDGGESFASNEACNSLVAGFPVIMNVSVTKAGEKKGSIFLSWIKPRDFNSIEAPGPYVFQIFRADSTDPDNFILIDSIQATDLNDTTYMDSPLNTINYPYYYKIRMINNTDNNRFTMRPDDEEVASSLYMNITLDDNQLKLNFRKKVPWINNQYIIYRRNTSLGYDSIATSSVNSFTDTGLKNGTTYYYQVKSIGWRKVDSSIYYNSNLSHISFGTPKDNAAPSAPNLTVESLCDSSMNILTWTNPNRSSSNDVVRYNIYYSGTENSSLDSLTSVSPDSDTIYVHNIIDYSLAGCYAVSAVDSFENESNLSTTVCVDKCLLYQLPNVFTPNGDGHNDTYLSYNLNNAIEKVNMKIFNRYGQLVYETADPAINWNGKYKNTDKTVSSGVYFYTCDVYEPRLSGIYINTLTGFIHLYAEGNSGREITK